MTNTYLTGNPLGSTAPRDLYDNASNFDEAVNSPSPSFVDRFGKRRETLTGLKNEVQNYLAASGYEPPVPYTAGLFLTRTTQTVEYLGNIYHPRIASLPLTTTDWASDSANFVLVAANQGRTAVFVNTVADAEALNLDVSVRAVFTLGYWEVGDKGASEYRVDLADTTTPRNGVTVLATGAGPRLKLVHSGRVSMHQGGARGNSDGNTGVGADDTTHIQNTFDAAMAERFQVIGGDGIFRTTAPLTIPTAMHFEGTPVEPYGTEGTWFYFDHTGKGMKWGSLTGEVTGLYAKGFGTRRNQPAPASGWVPNQHDWDIDADQPSGGDCYFEDVLIFNAYKGLIASGRATLTRIRGQAFFNLLKAPFNADTTRITDCHAWPFWNAGPEVKSYMQLNTRAYVLAKVDNPKMRGCFSLWAFRGLEIVDEGRGTTSKLTLEGCEFDSGKTGIFVDSSANNVSILATNISVQGEATGSLGIHILGPGCIIDIGTVVVSETEQSSIRVDASGCSVRIGQANLRNFDKSVTGFPGVYCAAGSTVDFATTPVFQRSGSGQLFEGPGSINCPLRGGYATGTTDGNGQVVVTHMQHIAPRRAQLTAKAGATGYTLAADNLAFDIMSVQVYLPSGAKAGAGVPVQFYYELAY